MTAKSRTERILGMTPEQAASLQDRYAHLLPPRPDEFCCGAIDDVDEAASRIRRAHASGQGQGQLTLDLRQP